MNQRKYLVYAVLILLAGTILFLIIQKLGKTKIVETSSTIIDYDVPIDSLSKPQNEGKMIFMSKCASCHAIFRDATGPALAGITERRPWVDSSNLYSYIRTPKKFDKNDYVQKLRKLYGSNHLGFPDLTNEEIRSILIFIKMSEKPDYNIVD